MASRVNITYKESRANDERSRLVSDANGRTASLDYEGVQSLFTARYTLQARLDSLQDRLRKPDIDSRLALKTLGEMRSSASILSSLVNDIDSIVPVSGRPTDRSAQKANEVFAVPELLEQILLPLTPKELLQAQQATRAFHDTIEGSCQLQEALTLRPNRKGFYHSLFSNGFQRRRLADFPGLTVRHHLITTPAGPGGYGRITRDVESAALRIDAAFGQGRALPRLGSRVRCMLVCQPPLRQVTIHVAETTRLTRGRPRPQVEKIEMTVPNGLTVGDMVDATLEVRAKYLDGQQSEEGEANSNALEVSFEGRIDLAEDDPLFPRTRYALPGYVDEDPTGKEVDVFGWFD